MTDPNQLRVSRKTQQRLAARFEATIPLRRPLIISYYSIMGTSLLTAIGLPARARQEVLYITTQPGRMLAVPLVCLVDIQPLHPEKASP